MIGHFVSEDDEHWLHYIELLDIVDLIFSPTLHPNTPGYLEVIIKENLEKFVALYGAASILPKMHFLIHVPRLLERYIKGINTLQPCFLIIAQHSNMLMHVIVAVLGDFRTSKNYM